MNIVNQIIKYGLFIGFTMGWALQRAPEVVWYQPITSVFDASFSENGRLAAFLPLFGHIQIYAPEQQAYIDEIRFSKDDKAVPSDIHLSKNGKILLTHTSTSKGSIITLYDMNDPISKISELKFSYPLISPILSASGESFYAISERRYLSEFNKKGDVIDSIEYDSKILSFELSDQEDLIALFGENKRLNIYTTQDRKLIYENQFNDKLQKIAISSKGSYLFLHSIRHPFLLIQWDSQESHKLVNQSVNRSASLQEMSKAVFHPSGKYLALIRSQDQLEIWSTDDGVLKASHKMSALLRNKRPTGVPISVFWEGTDLYVQTSTGVLWKWRLVELFPET